MKIIPGLMASALLLYVPVGLADDGKGYGCDSVNFSQEVLEKMPNAKVLCRGVVERNGGVFVHYIGKVVGKTADTVTIEFLDKNSKPISRATFKPAANQMVAVEKQKTKYMDVKTGTTLDFYIANNRWGLFGSPGDDAMTIVSVEQL